MPRGSMTWPSASMMRNRCVMGNPSAWSRAGSGPAAAPEQEAGERLGHRARRVTRDDVHHRRRAGGERALERRPQILDVGDVFAVAAERLGDEAVARGRE